MINEKKNKTKHMRTPNNTKSTTNPICRRRLRGGGDGKLGSIWPTCNRNETTEHYDRSKEFVVSLMCVLCILDWGFSPLFPCSGGPVSLGLLFFRPARKK